ncbi:MULTISPECIES: D-arabinono-1,4-lactone oxidase [Clostridia]|uniref:D-arabinono-1,4-lactone oxidase n=1 Tax=Clostridia TaxID=186801 RepID=UPI000EA0244A|nr:MULTISPECIES: D-arabinono-1,4-lactone oxidase [Clostridia]NBJ70246.1 FAD-binding protein [Roseburia sp. 1XD42-34]RKI76739.1 FAD-binding protein [Clostridium sp. 1xD42-85]
MKETFWKNWAETVYFQPHKVVYPTSIAEVCQIVKQAKKENQQIRVIGAGHSFTPIAASPGYLISLDNLTGIISIDEEQQTAVVLAGTRLYDLSKQLAEQGFSQENLGDINTQSLAGATLTGTHGTGIQFGNLATQVVELKMVNADGDVITVNAQSEVPLQAAAISLGLLGIVVEMAIRIIPAPTYRFESRKIHFLHLLQDMKQLIAENRHFECFMFPYSEIVQIKTMNLSEQVPLSVRKHRLKALVVENYAYQLLSETARFIPRTTRWISRLSAKAIGSSVIHAKNYDLFATARNVRFREMEYSIPLEKLSEALIAIRTKMEREGYHVHFPIEIRMAKGDDLWLSTAYARDSAYIAIHMYKGMPYEKYFQDMDALLQAYEARPHWGKMHNMNLTQLHRVYPKLEAFLNIREQLDPSGIFLNAYFAKLLETNNKENRTKLQKSIFAEV